MQKGYIEDNLMEVSNTLTTLPDPVRAIFLKLVQCPSTDMIEKRSIAHFILLLLKEQHNVPLEYIQQAQSLTDSHESQATIAMEIDQFVYLSKYFCPELGYLLYSSKKLSLDQRPSPCIVKLLEYIVCEIENITASNFPPIETHTIHQNMAEHTTSVSQGTRYVKLGHLVLILKRVQKKISTILQILTARNITL